MIGGPDSRYGMTAKFAAATFESVFDNTVPYPADKNLVAGRTIRVFAFVAGHIANIRIMEPRL